MGEASGRKGVGLEECFNVIYGTSEGDIRVASSWGGGVGAQNTDMFQYRNTIVMTNGTSQRFGITNGGDPVSWKDNVYFGAVIGVENTDYTDDGGNVLVTLVTDIDTDGNLVGTERTNNLGTSGYEVA